MNAENKRLQKTSKNEQASTARSSIGTAEGRMFVGRAGEKLAGALVKLRFSMRGKQVLDIGSSTGGFTQVCLRFGAKNVVAIEKGTKQMHPVLALHPQIDLREKTDIFTVRRADLPPIDVIVADVSFISIRTVIEWIIREFRGTEVEMLLMFKPQFEAKPAQLVRGIVKNERMRREILLEFEKWLKSHNILVKGKCDNELRGRYGNIERFYFLRLGKSRR